MVNKDKYLFEFIICNNDKYEKMNAIMNSSELISFIKHLSDLYYDMIRKGMFESKETEVKCMNELLEFVGGQIFDSSELIKDLKYNIQHEYDDNNTQKNIADIFLRLTSAIGYTE